MVLCFLLQNFTVSSGDKVGYEFFGFRFLFNAADFAFLDVPSRALFIWHFLNNPLGGLLQSFVCFVGRQEGINLRCVALVILDEFNGKQHDLSANVMLSRREWRAASPM